LDLAFASLTTHPNMRRGFELEISAPLVPIELTFGRAGDLVRARYDLR
jgi:hypothetical protein